MQIIHLPCAAVALLNALAAGDPGEEARGAFRSEREAAHAWLGFHGSFSTCEEEASDLANLAFLWEEVDRALELPHPGEAAEQLARSLYAACPLMDRIRSERARMNFAAHPEVNEALVSGAAALQGRGPLAALRERLPGLDAYRDNSWGLFWALRPYVPKELLGDIEEGFALFDRGRAALDPSALEGPAPAEGGAREGLEVALGELASGARLVEVLHEWDRARDRREQERFRRFRLPLVGHELEAMLEGGRTLARTQWTAGLRRCRQTLLPRLEGFLAQLWPCILLPEPLREERLKAVEQGVDRVRAAVSFAGDDPRSDAELLGALEEALASASAAFSALERDALRVDGLPEPQRTCGEVVIGLLAQSVPDRTLEVLLQRSPLPGGQARPLEEYLRTGERECLHEAVQLMVAECGTDPDSDLVTAFMHRSRSAGLLG